MPSSVSSVAGFAILTLAPMTLFAHYGLLTAIMIALALIASLFVLPGFLLLVADEPDGSGAQAGPNPEAAADRRA